MKLEAEIESLELKLADQRNMEAELRNDIKELENQLKLSKHIVDEMENKDMSIKSMKKSYLKEIDSLKKQIDFLKKISTVTENDTDIEELVNKIMVCL